MLKRFLVLVSLFLLANLPISAEPVASLNFNSKSFEDGAAAGSQIDDSYYIISLADGDFAAGSAKFISAILYVPTSLLANGTYDLEVLKPSKESNSANACSEDESSSSNFTLPSSSKVYIVLSDASFKTTPTQAITKGVVSTDDVATGSITFSNVTDSFIGLSVDGSFEINTKISSYSATVPLNLSCEETIKKTKVKYSKNSSTSAASGSFSEAIVITSTSSFDPGSFDF